MHKLIFYHNHKTRGTAPAVHLDESEPVREDESWCSFLNENAARRAYAPSSSSPCSYSSFSPTPHIAKCCEHLGRGILAHINVIPLHPALPAQHSSASPMTMEVIARALTYYHSSLLARGTLTCGTRRVHLPHRDSLLLQPARGNKSDV